MGKAMLCCILGAAAILIIFIYFLGGMWINVIRKRLGLDEDAPFAWIKLAIWIEGTLELLEYGLFTRLYLNLTMGDKADHQRDLLASNWTFKGIVLGIIIITLIVHIVRNIHMLGSATFYLLLHLILDPIALITPKDEVKELEQQYVDAMAKQEVSQGK